jgi:hypothetical protein
LQELIESRLCATCPIPAAAAPCQHGLTGPIPLRVVDFNTAEGWVRDVSEDIARAVLKRAAEPGLSLSSGARRFVARYADERELLPFGT